MSQELIFMIVTYLVGGLIFVGINAFVVGRYVSNLATKAEVEKVSLSAKAELKEKVQERDAKLKEHGEWINRDFVRKGMCDQAHAFMDKENHRKEEDSKTFRLEMKEAFHQLQRQFENFQKEMFERLPKKE